MLKHNAAIRLFRAIPELPNQVQDSRGRAPVKITAALADEAQYVPVSSSMSSGMQAYFQHAEARRVLRRLGQQQPRAITNSLLLAVALARGIEGRILPAPDQADGEHALALLKYAALIEG